MTMTNWKIMYTDVSSTCSVNMGNACGGWGRLADGACQIGGRRRHNARAWDTGVLGQIVLVSKGGCSEQGEWVNGTIRKEQGLNSRLHGNTA